MSPASGIVRDIIEATHIGLTEFYWVSSPDVTHSRNIAVRPEVGIVVFDSQAAIGTGRVSAN